MGGESRGGGRDGPTAPRLGRRRFVRGGLGAAALATGASAWVRGLTAWASRAAAPGGAAALAAALSGGAVHADDHEPWRKLIPKVPPPPSLDGPGDLADYARL